MKENVPDARMESGRTGESAGAPDDGLQVDDRPVGGAGEHPAFFTSRVPRYRLTAPVIVEFEVKALTVVVGVSAVAIRAVALPANDPEMSPR